MSEVSIKKVVVKIGDKEISLSLDEAKELQDILNRTFGQKETVFVPSAPAIIERPRHPSHPHRTATREASSAENYTITASNTAGGQE